MFAVAAPVLCIWQGIDRSFSHISEDSETILIYNFIIITFRAFCKEIGAGTN